MYPNQTHSKRTYNLYFNIENADNKNCNLLQFSVQLYERTPTLS